MGKDVPPVDLPDLRTVLRSDADSESPTVKARRKTARCPSRLPMRGCGRWVFVQLTTACFDRSVRGKDAVQRVVAIGHRTWTRHSVKRSSRRPPSLLWPRKCCRGEYCRRQGIRSCHRERQAGSQRCNRRREVRRDRRVDDAARLGACATIETHYSRTLARLERRARRRRTPQPLAAPHTLR